MRTIADLIYLAGVTNSGNGYNGYEQARADGYGTHYLAMKDMLDVSELTEALDELRHGHSPDEIYYGEDGKPEGYIIEKLDAIIRAFGTLYEVAMSHDLTIDMIERLLVDKINYNAIRHDTATSGEKVF